MNIVKDLTLSEDEPTARHIVGTHVDDLTQLYTGKVFIKGSLTLNNVFYDWESVKIISDSFLFDGRIPKNYWMKSFDQDFVDFTFENEVKIANLITKFINGHAITHYLRNLKEETAPVSLLFEKAVIPGHLTIQNRQNEHLLKKIAMSAVRRKEKSVITGKKTFTGVLRVDHFNSNYMDGIHLDALVKKSEKNFNFFGVKQFSKINFTNCYLHIHTPNFYVLEYNDKDLVQFFHETVNLNEDNVFDTLHFQSFASENAFVHKINGQEFGKFIDHLNVFVRPSPDEPQVLLENLYIKKDAKFLKRLYTSTVNGRYFDDYVRMCVPKYTNFTYQIGGQKKFVGNLLVNGNMYAHYVNNLNLHEFFKTRLTESGVQSIGGRWTFDEIETNYMKAKDINGVKTKFLIDKNSNDVHLNSPIFVEKVAVFGNLGANLPMSIAEMEYKIMRPEKTHYKYLNVDHNLNMESYTQQTPLFDILFSSVERESPIKKEIVVTGDVLIDNKETNFNYIYSNNMYFKDEIDFMQLLTDSLRRKPVKKQIVTGKKKFRNHFHVKNSLIAKDYLQTYALNKIDLALLNMSIYRIVNDQFAGVSGVKKFDQPLTIIDLQAVGALNNGIYAENLVYLSQMSSGISTHLNFENIVINGNLKVTTINEYSLQHFFAKRVRLTASPEEEQTVQETNGEIVFENLKIDGDLSKITSINGVSLNDIVTEISKDHQLITGRKIIKNGSLYVEGPTSALKINNVDALEAYKDTIFRKNIPNHQPIGKIHINDEVKLTNGIFLERSVNQRSVAQLFDVRVPHVDQLLPLTPAVKDQIKYLDRTHKMDENSKRFLYIDHDPTMKIVYHNPSARTSVPESYYGFRVPIEGKIVKLKKS